MGEKSKKQYIYGNFAPFLFNVQCQKKGGGNKTDFEFVHAKFRLKKNKQKNFLPLF